MKKTKNKKSKNMKKTKSKNKLSKTSFMDKGKMLFIAFFAVIGTVLFGLSLASPAKLASIEAESMNIAGDAEVLSGWSNASNDEVVRMRSYSTLTSSVDLSSRATTMKVRARGIRCNGAPNFAILVDDKKIATETIVSEKSLEVQTINVSIPEGRHKLGLRFVNSYSTNSCRRVILMDYVELYGEEESAESTPTGELLSREAESLSIPSGATVKSGWSAASGGKVVKMVSASTLTGSIDLPGKVSSVKIRARGIRCDGAPKLGILIDGNQVVSRSIDSAGSLAEYTVSASISAGSHKLGLRFLNPRNTSSCRRVIILDYIKMYGQSDSGSSEPVPTTNEPDTTSDPEPSTTTASGSDLKNGYTRQSLLKQRAGFGRFAGGRGDGTYDDSLKWSEYVVTSSDINATGSGTLRNGLSQGRRWITFKKGLTINQATASAIKPASGRWVIDGRGANITIRTQNSNNFVILDKDNWIMTNLTFRLNSSASSSPDMVQNEASDDWWVHQVTFVGVGPWDKGSTGDGALDTGGAKIDGKIVHPGKGTVSYCRFQDHGKLSLAVWEHVNGVTPETDRSKMAKYTYHHNLFRNNFQRQPLTRSALLDFVNNWLDGWGLPGNSSTGQGLQSQEKAQAYVRNNILDAGARKVGAASGSGRTSRGYVKNGGGNLLTNGAQISTYNSGAVFNPSDYYSFPVEAANQSLRDRIQSKAGAQ